MLNELEQFILDVSHAFNDKSLQKLVLTQYRGDDPELERITIRPVEIKNEEILSFLYKYRTRDITKNLPLDKSIGLWKQWLGGDFQSAHLLTNEWEVQLGFSKKGKVLFSKHRNKNTANKPLQHDKEKNRFIEQTKPYLQDLGITDSQGKIIPSMSNKWKQINKFIEILSGAITNTGLARGEKIHVADFGSGKAYLTFAVHDYLSTQYTTETKVTGVELRQNLVELCNQVAEKNALKGIAFQQGDVKHYTGLDINIMIALHACDIATDYAIHMGIRNKADIIMCSPCCHKQIRPQLKSPGLLKPILHHGIHLGQEAEMITDGLRALFLEANGYDTKVFEFISLEHTSKNKMILAQKRLTPKDTSEILLQIRNIKEFYGIQEHCLEQLLKSE
jgi:Methyltransferase domain